MAEAAGKGKNLITQPDAVEETSIWHCVLAITAVVQAHCSKLAGCWSRLKLVQITLCQIKAGGFKGTLPAVSGAKSWTSLPQSWSCPRQPLQQPHHPTLSLLIQHLPTRKNPARRGWPATRSSRSSRHVASGSGEASCPSPPSAYVHMVFKNTKL